MWISALVFGLLSSLHCMGMCGPIALMLPLNRKSESTKILGLLTYHFGRITAYVSIGMVFGILGRWFRLGGWQQNLSIIAGVCMIILALISEKRIQKLTGSGRIGQMLTQLKSALAQRFKKQSYASLYSIGLLNGFLPCGMVYAAVFGALAASSLAESLLFMFCFGLGTVPLVSLVNLMGGAISPVWRSKLVKLVPVVMCLMGALFIARGMGLGIAYVSPSNLNLMVKSQPHCK